MSNLISQKFHECCKIFEQGLDALKDRDGVCVYKWSDEMGRLRIWAANIGAHQTNQSSLDFRLRDAPHIHQQIVNLLDDLMEASNDLRVIFCKPEDEEMRSTDLDDADSLQDEDEETELNQLHDSFINIIDCLYQMSMLVRKAARQRMWSDTDFESGIEPFDKTHVAHKFPTLSSEIQDRLGRANTRRRVQLKRRERRRAKFGKGMDDAQNETLSDTVATDFASSGIDREDSVSVGGSTVYASSLYGGGGLTIPPPPKDSSDRKRFECPFCFYIITINNTHSWTKHVFQDLLPYTCPYLACPSPEKLYGSRHDWSDHLHSSHSEAIIDGLCPLCTTSLASDAEFKRHLARHLEDLALFVLPRLERGDEPVDNHIDPLPETDTSLNSAEQGTTTEKKLAVPDAMDIDWAEWDELVRKDFSIKQDRKKTQPKKGTSFSIRWQRYVLLSFAYQVLQVKAAEVRLIHQRDFPGEVGLAAALGICGTADGAKRVQWSHHYITIVSFVQDERICTQILLQARYKIKIVDWRECIHRTPYLIIDPYRMYRRTSHIIFGPNPFGKCSLHGNKARRVSLAC
ncbi:MAG: hypothetical protein L6R41_005605 [Letrouitia leprolyta]|nr:MAG: hypothetical protein L6R41_005605 [Letrouitia leprolyta]